MSVSARKARRVSFKKLPVKVMEENPKFFEYFDAFKSSYSNKLMSEEQQRNLHRLQEARNNSGITLSQIDEWMMEAGLIKKKVLSLTETGLVFSKFKSFSLNQEQFIKFLEIIASEKKLDFEEIITKLISVELPGPGASLLEPEIPPESIVEQIHETEVQIETENQQT